MYYNSPTHLEYERLSVLRIRADYSYVQEENTALCYVGRQIINTHSHGRNARRW